MLISLMTLIENRCSEEEIKKVKSAIIIAQDRFENSWDPKSGKYKINNLIAAKLACKKVGLEKFWVNIISSLNLTYWNDIQSWAEAKMEN